MEVLNAFAGAGLDYGILLFLRVSGMTLSSPVFGRENIPIIAKVSFSLALTYFFFTIDIDRVPPEYSGLPVFVLLCAKELLIGLIMGYLLTLFFSAAFTAGQLIDMQMGFGMANVYDEQSNASVPLLGNLINFMMMLIFISADGFERLIVMLRLTLTYIPIGTVTVSTGIVWTLAELFSNAFLLGLRMAIPVIMSGIVGEAMMGMLVRTVPQMNVFVIGLPMRVLLGLLVFMGVLPVYLTLTGTLFDQMFAGMEQVFAGLRAG